MRENRKEVIERLEYLALQNGGRLTPEQVVADAKDQSSPLHSYFEWDVQKAAQQFWLDQARELIRSVKIEVKTETSVIRTVAYVRDPGAGPKDQGYVSLEKLRSDEDAAREAIVYEFARAAATLRRAREIAAALNLAEEVDSIIAKVDTMREQAQAGLQ